MIESASSSRMEITLPPNIWVGDLSRHFPETVFEFKSSIPVGVEEMICNNLFLIKGSHMQEALDELKNFSEIDSIGLLETTPTQISLILQSRGHVILYSLLKYEIAIEFPIIVQNGEVFLQIVGNHEHMDQLIEDLTQKSMQVVLHQIGPYHSATVFQELTPRQREIYQKARLAGYYDVPRRITLSTLAQQENISKSTLSMTLQRIHKKVLGDFPVALKSH